MLRKTKHIKLGCMRRSSTDSNFKAQENIKEIQMAEIKFTDNQNLLKQKTSQQKTCEKSTNKVFKSKLKSK